MINKQKTIFNTIHQNAVDYTLADFEGDVQKAAQAGATHMMVGQLEKSRWIWERDRSDPYPNWGMLLLSLFKLIVPAELKGYLPADYAARNLAVLKARMLILKKYGLKGALHFAEPFYLPEQVYRDHPAWRGPRCDHPRRARNAYYSPCVDHPEVLAVYRSSMRDLFSQVDVDYVFIHTNDCGSGLCWSSGLYCGANGPAACQHRSPADRITGFLEVLRQGAADAGKAVDIEINSNIGFKEPEHAMDAIWSQLKDHTAVNFRTNRGVPLTAMVDVGYEYSIAPVRNIPLVMSFLHSLEAAHQSEASLASFTLASCDHDEYMRICAAFNRRPTYGPRDRAELLRGLALEIVREAGPLQGAEASPLQGAEAAADDLLTVWEKINTGMTHYQDTNIEGLVSCCVNQRWTNRPFVLFPAELTEQEKGYYRPYQFQANDEAQANDLLNLQCTTFIRGYYAIFLASRALGRAIECNRQAITILTRLSQQAGGESFALLADRLRLLNCFYTTAVHAMKFQDIVDHTDASQAAEISPRWPIDAEPRLLDYEAITRAEIDNTLEMICLIDGRVREMLVTAPTPDLEDIFMFSPNLVAQLRQKIDIMLNHQLDGKRVFVTHNK